MKVDDLVGQPFVDGGVGPDGFDCWGLVRFIYARELDVLLPTFPISAFEENKVADAIKTHYKELGFNPVCDIKAGDVITLSLEHSGLVNHVALAINKYLMIHPLEKKGVIISKLSDLYFKSRIDEVYRWQR